MTNGSNYDLSDMSMMDLFRMEAENQCSLIGENLLALEQDPEAPELLESLMRASHSLKGAARVVELNGAVQVAHAMEDVFVAAQESRITLDRDGIDLLLKGLDLFSAIARVPEAETENFFAARGHEIDSLVNSYAALSKGEKTVPGAVAGHTADPQPPPATPHESVALSFQEGAADLPVDLSSLSMFDLFRLEAEKHCTRLSRDLNDLQRDPARRDLFDPMIRACLSMKDAAKIVEMTGAAELAQAMADVFHRVQAGAALLSPDDIDIMLSTVVFLTTGATIREDESAGWFAAHSGEIEGRLGMLAQIAPGKNKPAARDAFLKDPSDSAALQREQGPVPAGPVPAAEGPQTKKPGRRAEDLDGIRSVRVAAQSMDRMMGLAGEALIASRWLPEFNRQLLRLKHRQDELSQLMDRLSENLQTAEAANPDLRTIDDFQEKLSICRQMLLQDMEALDEHARHATRTSHLLYNEILASKMRPFSEGIRGFPRMIRDLARELGKEVRLEVSGSATMMDRDILDKIEAPLNHLIRNCVDHGLEIPAERLARGKERHGTVSLKARHSGGMLISSVSDDGCGIDLEKLRRMVVEKKLCDPALALNLADHELLEFLFLPNFSTKEKVSSISGRGVGMDVVRTAINEVRGKIDVSTGLHQGTTFELQLPLTLSVLRALLAEINGEPYAFPLAAIDHVLQLSRDQLHEVEGRQYFTFKEKRIGIVSAQQVFQTKTTAAPGLEGIHVIVFSDKRHSYSLTVDRLLGVRDLVVQHLDPRLGKIKDISSGSILEDGTPVLIVDVDDVFNSLEQLISGNRLVPIDSGEDKLVRKKRILVADDSITVREVERKMLSARGYDVDVAVDGMDAWNTVRAKSYDLIISDIDMPRLNGFELVKLIKNDTNLRHLPVIIVSYKDSPEDRNRGLEAGADYYITKGSFQDQALVNAVLELIGGPQE
ncbi:MAG: hybrid sensor histidine kinase/response regulator [Deltaproteobacteria bacterium]|jgi:two-component system sensor histidine kinase and response regulator WspE|nr:hybrid sensor histidine kinase/response regulator [Deltaproteobacteria bacterium]